MYHTWDKEVCQGPYRFGLKCLRCGYEWKPQHGNPPKTCALCRSPYWNTPVTHPERQTRKGNKR